MVSVDTSGVEVSLGTGADSDLRLQTHPQLTYVSLTNISHPILPLLLVLEWSIIFSVVLGSCRTVIVWTFSA